MPDESDYGVEIPPRDHGPPVADDTVTLEPKRFHTGIRVSPEYAEELRAARELTLCIMKEHNERLLGMAAAIDAAVTATPPDDAGRCTPVVPANWPFRDDVTPEEIDQLRQTFAAGRPAGFTLYGLPVVVKSVTLSPSGIVFGPDIVPPATPPDDADTPHVVES